MKLIVCSEKDIAGSNMYDLFSSEFGFVKEGSYDGFTKYIKDDFVLLKVNNEILNIEKLCSDFKPEVYICASKHKSEKKHLSLTVHSTGNWDNAEAGGSPRELCVNPACYVKKALQSLTSVEGFDITLEVTHHGPSQMNAPILFVEVGSSKKEWGNLEACRSVCKAILSLDKVSNCPVAIGFGGPHYAPNFTKAVLNSEYAIGHICPKHYVDILDKEMVKQAFENNFPKPSLALLDWKGLTGPQREKLISIFEELNITWKRLKEIN